MNARHQRFGLTLMVNHACNLRCTYCYTGAKSNTPLTWEIGLAAIARGFRSLESGGQLDLGFFGGEPLLESTRILEWMAQSRIWAAVSGRNVGFNLITNGTITDRDAWQVMLDEDLDLAVSYDGTPEIHDRYRRDAGGRVSAAVVEKTIRQLIESGRNVRVVTVVRPDNLDELPEGLVYLREIGIRRIDLSLDLWARWNAADLNRLEVFIRRAAELWRQWLPDFSLNWFDAKAGSLVEAQSVNGQPRPGLNCGEIAVAPSGRLYPCEKLIGEDRPGQPQQLRGNALDGEDFLDFIPTGCRFTFCRCANFIRTGDVSRSDGLLRTFHKATTCATERMLALPITLPAIRLEHRRCSVT